jgi:hypothetical protein
VSVMCQTKRLARTSQTAGIKRAFSSSNSSYFDLLS